MPNLLSPHIYFVELKKVFQKPFEKLYHYWHITKKKIKIAKHKQDLAFLIAQYFL
jgi:hypothetical protein